MTWTSAIPAFIAAILTLYLPGLVVASTLRLRAHLTAVIAPVLSALVLFLTAVITGLLSKPWNLLWLVAITLVTAAAFGLISWLVDRFGWSSLTLLRPVERGESRRSWRILTDYLIGIALTSLVALPSYLKAIGSPENVMQRWDNAFHLNAIRWIAQTGKASPLDIGWMVDASFYPVGWHDLVAIVFKSSGVPLTACVHASFLVAILLVWPLGLSGIVESLTLTNRAMRLAVGPLSLMFMSYPHMILDGGGLYSNAFGLALAPALLAIAMQALQISVAPQLPLVKAVLLAGAMLLGVGSAHPNAAMGVAALIVPAMLWAAWLAFRRTVDASAEKLRWVSPRWWAVLSGVLILLLGAAWLILAPDLDVAPWGRFQSIPQAFGEVALGTTMTKRPIWPGSLLFLAGIIVILRRRLDLVWSLLMYAVAAGLYIVTTAFGSGRLRNYITGVFYNDARRTGGLLALLLAPIAVIAVAALVDGINSALAARTTRLAPARRKLIIDVLVPVTLLAGLLTSNGFAAQLETLNDTYQYKWDAEMLSTDEKIMLDRLPSLISPDDRILADPLTGAGLAYALSDSDVVKYYVFEEPNDDAIVLSQRLNQAVIDPQACAAAQRLRVSHVLLMDPHLMGNEPDFHPGLKIDSQTPGFQLVERVGRVRLYQFTGCQS